MCVCVCVCLCVCVYERERDREREREKARTHTLSSSPGVICNNCSRNNLANRGKGQVCEVSTGGKRRWEEKKKEKKKGNRRNNSRVIENEKKGKQRWREPKRKWKLREERRGEARRTLPLSATSLCCCIEDEWCLSGDWSVAHFLPSPAFIPSQSWKKAQGLPGCVWIPVETAHTELLQPRTADSCIVPNCRRDGTFAHNNRAPLNHIFPYGGQRWHST